MLDLVVVENLACPHGPAHTPMAVVVQAQPCDHPS